MENRGLRTLLTSDGYFLCFHVAAPCSCVSGACVILVKARVNQSRCVSCGAHKHSRSSFAAFHVKLPLASTSLLEIDRICTLSLTTTYTPACKILASPMEVSRICECANAGCPNKGELRCVQCKSIQYCSEACQKEDWYETCTMSRKSVTKADLCTGVFTDSSASTQNPAVLERIFTHAA